MKPIILAIFLWGTTSLLIAQTTGVSINDNGNEPDASAILDVQSIDKGMLTPRMTTTQRMAISNPATGLLVFDINTDSFWYYNGNTWTELVTGTPSTLSDTDGDTKIEVEESPDEDAIRFYRKNVEVMNVGGVPGTVETASGLGHYSNLLSLGWQSFTAPENVDIISVEILYSSSGGLPTKDFNIYDGEGTGGTKLADLGSSTLSDGWNTIPLSTPVSIAAGQKYTLSFSNFSGVGFDGSNQYPDGMSNYNFNADWSIRVNWRASTSNVNMNTVLNVNNTVTASAFVGDGSGLTNLPGDNLGNHTATQNLQLAGFYLSGDGDNEGVYVANNGNAGIGTTNPENTLDLVGNLGSTNGVMTIQNTNATGFAGTYYRNYNGIRSGYIGWVNSTATNLNGPGTLQLSSGAARITLHRGTGLVGIGTATPTKAKLEIDGFASYDPAMIGYLNLNGQVGSYNPVTYQYSIYASHTISGQEFHAHSDQRIKEIQGVSDRESDLKTLMQIEITNYRLRDSISKGNRPVKKVIAQQVAEVYPQAVRNNLTEVVPDIYQRAEMKNSWIMLATDLQDGERVKMITKQSSEVYEVINVQSNRFQVKGMSIPSTDTGAEIFVYGREVDDFHTVDYEAISMLNVSATQQQQRIIEQLSKENTTLQSELSAQQNRIDLLEQELTKISALLSQMNPVSRAN